MFREFNRNASSIKAGIMVRHQLRVLLETSDGVASDQPARTTDQIVKLGSLDRLGFAPRRLQRVQFTVHS